MTIGRKTSPGDATSLAPGFPPPSEWLGDRLVFDDTGWVISPDDPQGAPGFADNPPGQVLLAQLSTQDGTGFFGTMLVGGFSNGVDFQQTVSFDTQQVPAPGALAILGAAGLLCPGRRWRRSSPDLARSGMEVAAAAPR